MASYLAHTTLILQCIGDQINPLDKKTLRALCLVSRLFNDVFSPYLWRRLEPSIFRGLDVAERLEHCDNIKWVEELALSDYELYYFDHNTRVNTILDLYQDALDRALERTPNLRYISITQTCDFSLRPYLKKAISSRAQHIRGLFLGFDNPVRATTLTSHPTQDLSYFGHLRSLVIHSPVGNQDKWIEYLARVLIENEGLQHLSLIRYKDRIRYQETRYDDDPYVHMVSMICDHFHKQGGRPLDLKSLRLRRFDLPILPRLRLLLNVDALEEFDVRDQDGHRFPTRIDPPLITRRTRSWPLDIPHMKQLRVLAVTGGEGHIRRDWKSLSRRAAAVPYGSSPDLTRFVFVRDPHGISPQQTQKVRESRFAIEPIEGELPDLSDDFTLRHLQLVWAENDTSLELVSINQLLSTLQDLESFRLHVIFSMPENLDVVETARQFAHHGRKLTHVAIGNRAWRVQRISGSDGCQLDEVDVRLRETPYPDIESRAL